MRIHPDKVAATRSYLAKVEATWDRKATWGIGLGCFFTLIAVWALGGILGWSGPLSPGLASFALAAAILLPLSGLVAWLQHRHDVHLTATLLGVFDDEDVRLASFYAPEEAWEGFLAVGIVVFLVDLVSLAPGAILRAVHHHKMVRELANVNRQIAAELLFRISFDDHSKEWCELVPVGQEYLDAMPAAFLIYYELIQRDKAGTSAWPVHQVQVDLGLKKW